MRYIVVFIVFAASVALADDALPERAREAKQRYDAIVERARAEFEKIQERARQQLERELEIAKKVATRDGDAEGVKAIEGIDMSPSAMPEMWHVFSVNSSDAPVRLHADGRAEIMSRGNWYKTWSIVDGDLSIHTERGAIQFEKVAAWAGRLPDGRFVALVQRPE